jgi:hypothetical protein
MAMADDSCLSVKQTARNSVDEDSWIGKAMKTQDAAGLISWGHALDMYKTYTRKDESIYSSVLSVADDSQDISLWDKFGKEIIESTIQMCKPTANVGSTRPTMTAVSDSRNRSARGIYTPREEGEGRDINSWMVQFPLWIEQESGSWMGVAGLWYVYKNCTYRISLTVAFFTLITQSIAKINWLVSKPFSDEPAAKLF